MPAVDVTEDYIRIRQKDPGDFQDGSMRTVVLDEAKGIKAVMGKLKGSSTMTIQTYLFDVDKWDEARAKAWVEKHKGGYQSKDWQRRMSGYQGDPRFRVERRGGDIYILRNDAEPEPVSEPASFRLSELGSFDHVDLDAEGVPVAFRIWAFGTTSTDKYGDLVLDAAGAQEAMAAYKAKGMERLPIDWEHQTYASLHNGQPAPAIGWFTLGLRADGFWAEAIEWTDIARGWLKAKSYRHFSPTGAFDPKTKRIIAVHTIGLTNMPATNNQLPLVARSEDKMGSMPAESGTEVVMKKVLARLSLPEGATEDEALAKLEEMLKAVEPPAPPAPDAASVQAKAEEIAALRAKADALPALETFRARVMESVGLKPDAKDEDLQAAIVTLKAQAPEAARVVEMQAKIETLERFREDTRIAGLMARVAEYVTPAIKPEVEDLARKLPETVFLATVQRFPKVKAEPEKPIGDKALAERNGDDAAAVLDDKDREYLTLRKIAVGSPEYANYVATRRQIIADEKARSRA